MNYNVSDMQNSIFYQMPKWLFQGVYKDKLTNNQRVIYSVLLERMRLSISNAECGMDNYIDENGDIYFIFNQQSLADEVGLSRKTTNESIKSLIKIGLLNKVRQGQGKVDRMYLQKHNPEYIETANPYKCSDVTKSYIKMSKNVTSRCNESTHLDVTNSYTNNNNNNNTDNSNTNQFNSIHISDDDIELKRTELMNRMNYNNFSLVDQARLDELIDNLLSEVYYTTRDYIELGNREYSDTKPRALVVNQIEKNISYGTALNYVDAMNKVSGTINNPSRYILKTFYSKCVGGRTQAQTQAYYG